MMHEGRLDTLIGADGVIEVHRAAARQHESIGDAVLDELFSYPLGELDLRHPFQPFQIAVRRMASSSPTVGTRPSSS